MDELNYMAEGPLLSPPPPSCVSTKVMDELNYMVQDQGLPDDLATRLRSYWRAVQHLTRLQSYERLKGLMSIQLQVQPLPQAWGGGGWGGGGLGACGLAFAPPPPQGRLSSAFGSRCFTEAWGESLF